MWHMISKATRVLFTLYDSTILYSYNVITLICCKYVKGSNKNIIYASSSIARNLETFFCLVIISYISWNAR